MNTIKIANVSIVIMIAISPRPMLIDPPSRTLINTQIKAIIPPPQNIHSLFSLKTINVKIEIVIGVKAKIKADDTGQAVNRTKKKVNKLIEIIMNVAKTKQNSRLYIKLKYIIVYG